MTLRLDSAELPTDRPDGFADALAARAATVVRIEIDPPKTYVWADSPDQKLWAWYSRDPSDEARVAYEAAVREAVGTDGPLRAPPLLARGPLWRIEERFESEPVSGEAALTAVVHAMTDLAGRSLPPRPNDVGRETRLAMVRRRTAIIRSPLPVREFVRARRALASVTLPLVTAHGDLFCGHILMRAGVPWIIDWELCGLRPAGYDLLYLWADLPDERDRDQIYASAVSMVGQRHAQDVALLRYALLVRMIAAKVGDANPHNRQPAEAERMLRLLPEVRRAAGIR